MCYLKYFHINNNTFLLSIPDDFVKYTAVTNDLSDKILVYFRNDYKYKHGTT
jgi:hypothetical protein